MPIIVVLLVFSRCMCCTLLGDPAPVARKVAFFVGLKENLGPIANHADVVFDGIVTNIGGAYDSETGRFNAPLSGSYQFNIVVAAQGRQRVSYLVSIHYFFV